MTKSANQVRIIGGEFRGRRLSFAPVAGLRPTPDRVRETLFNWLAAEIPRASCLDCFAGSGALGFEALSRGAKRVVLAEQARPAQQRLREALSLLEVADRAELWGGDVLRRLTKPASERFDIVFLDPPYASRLQAKTVELLTRNGWLADRAWLYLEQDSAQPGLELGEPWSLHRHGQAGQAEFQLWFKQG